MKKYDDDFGFSDTQIVPAKTLPKGWKWIKYDDGSGYLKAPDDTEYMSYDLETNEYQVTKDDSYDLFPLSYYYGDGIDPKDFKPFEFMENKIRKMLFKENNKEKLENKWKIYKDMSNNLTNAFNYENFGFYLGINNIKKDLSMEEIDSLMNICYKNTSYYIDPIYLGEEVTRAVYENNYLSLEELKQLPYDTVSNLLTEDKMYLLKKYSKENGKDDLYV